MLQAQGINPTVVEYLKSPLTLEQLRKLSSHFALKDFVRANEPVFKSLGLSLEEKDKVLQAMAKEPILMQRPIVTTNGKAVIARPPEKVLEIL